LGIVAGVVETFPGFASCSSFFTGVAGDLELMPLRVDAKSPENKDPPGVAGFGKSSFADPSPLKDEPSLNALEDGSPKSPLGCCEGACGVGVDSSRSRFCCPLSPLKSVSLEDANDEFVPFPNIDPPVPAGVFAQDGNVDPSPKLEPTESVDPKLLVALLDSLDKAAG
jgi:hypothetical protein